MGLDTIPGLPLGVSFDAETVIRTLYENSFKYLSEKQQRLVAANYAKQLGRGGQTIVHKATGMSYQRIKRGLEELQFLDMATNPDLSFGSLDNTESQFAIDVLTSPDRIRLVGGGRPRIVDKSPDVRDWVRDIINECSYGDPMTSKRWTTASLTYIREVIYSEHQTYISRSTISDIVKELGFSLQKNKKMLQVGNPHPDRDKQFVFMNQIRRQFIAAGEPTISTDTKKKELLGNYASTGQEYRRKGDPRPSLDHDFKKSDGIRISPYGIYIINSNHGYVNLGLSSDTAEFAVNSIKAWWIKDGIKEFPSSKQLLIFCDGGGSNGSRCRLWKWELGKFARDYNIEIHICHFPPGTSKWNLVEHRLFSEISKNWSGKHLTSPEVALGYIEGTKTNAGLYVRGEIDCRTYEKGIKISDSDIKKVKIERKDTCPNWNYIITGIDL